MATIRSGESLNGPRVPDGYEIFGWLVDRERRVVLNPHIYHNGKEVDGTIGEIPFDYVLELINYHRIHREFPKD